MNLFGARQTRLIEEVQAALSVIAVLSAGQMKLQRMRLDPGFLHLLRRAGSRREAFDLADLLFGGFTDCRK